MTEDDSVQVLHNALHMRANLYYIVKYDYEISCNYVYLNASNFIQHV